MTTDDLPPTCRLCGSGSIKVRGVKQGRFRDIAFHFLECRNCSLLFVVPVVGPEIYDDRYYRGEGPDPLVDYESEYADYAATPRIHEFRDLYRLAAHHLDGAPGSRGSIRWLDYGCGAGGLLKFLRDAGSLLVGGREISIDASGFDVGSYADKLRIIDQLRIWDRADLELLPDNSFEIISCIEVIEHLAEPVQVLELLSRLLTPGGLLLLSTGNLRSPLARALGINFPYCVPEIHVSYFSPPSMRYIYDKVGLRPVNVRFSGALRFKFLKSISPLLPRGIAESLSMFTPLLGLLDFAYGVSAMPSASKDPGQERTS